jgi:hypothetical protein
MSIFYQSCEPERLREERKILHKKSRDIKTKANVA